MLQIATCAVRYAGGSTAIHDTPGCEHPPHSHTHTHTHQPQHIPPCSALCSLLPKDESSARACRDTRVVLLAAFEVAGVFAQVLIAVAAVCDAPLLSLSRLLSRLRTYDDIQVNDMALEDYIAVKQKQRYHTYLPHTAKRYNLKRFRKAQCPIVERLTNSLMMHGRNNGKKLMAVRIVKHAFEIIHLLTDKNPVQVLVDAVINSGPREDSTRVGSAGTSRRQAVDVSPLRRVNQAVYLLTTGVRIFSRWPALF